MSQASEIKNLPQSSLDSYFESGKGILLHLDHLIQQVSCRRRKVGAILARNRKVVASAHNGPAAYDQNDCRRCRISGMSTVMPACSFDHAEARSCSGALPGDTLLTSTSPCPECAALILQKGISTVFYLEGYLDLTPVTMLVASGVTVYHLTQG